MKMLVLQAVVMLVALAIIFYLIGQRGPMLVALAVVPTALGVFVLWLRARQPGGQRS